MTGTVELRITGGTPLEVLARATAFGLNCMQEPRIAKLANEIMEAEKYLKVKTKDAAPATAPAPAPAPAEDSTKAPANNTPAPAEAEPPQEPHVGDAPESPKPPTLEVVRAKGIEAAKKHGQAAVKKILTQLGAANMTSLPEDKRADFLDKLKKLGDGNA